MSLTLIPILIRAVRANGVPVAGARVRARLTVEDYDAGLVVPLGVDGQTDDSGECIIQLWPNARGVNGSQYRVVIDGGEESYFSGLITVPEAASSSWPVLLDLLINQPPYPKIDVAQQAQTAAAASALEASAAARQVREELARYDLGLSTTYPPVRGETIAAFALVRTAELLQAGGQSRAIAVGEAPSQEALLEIHRNGLPVGLIRWLPGEAEGLFEVEGSAQFTDEDVLSIVASDGAENLAGVGVTLRLSVNEVTDLDLTGVHE